MPDVWDGMDSCYQCARSSLARNGSSGLFHCSKVQKISPRSKYFKSLFYPYIDLKKLKKNALSPTKTTRGRIAEVQIRPIRRLSWNCLGPGTNSGDEDEMDEVFVRMVMVM